MIHIAIIDAVGATAFLLTFAWAVYNFVNDVGVSSYWLLFATAAFAGAVWAGSGAAEWFGLYPVLIDELQPTLSTVVAAIFALTGIVSYLIPIDHTIA